MTVTSSTPIGNPYLLQLVLVKDLIKKTLMFGYGCYSTRASHALYPRFAERTTIMIMATSPCHHSESESIEESFEDSSLKVEWHVQCEKPTMARKCHPLPIDQGA